MTTTLAQASWDVIEALRERVSVVNATVEGSARAFAAAWADTFPSIVLARVFLVLPARHLPATDRAVAARTVNGDARFGRETRVLSLLGTRGREPAWNDRSRSAGHLAIPLLDRSFVEGAPMIAQLLAHLDVDLAALDDGRPLATRSMLGGTNSTFYVPDALTAQDDEKRFVIPGREFVTQYGVRTVFGMAGAYFEGTLAVAVLFTTEILDRLTVNHY